MTEELLNSFNNGAKKWKPDHAGVWQLYITYFRSCQAKNRGIERLNRKIKKLNIELLEAKSYKADAERYRLIKNISGDIKQLIRIINIGSPSCQNKIVENCLCTNCVRDRLEKALEKIGKSYLPVEAIDQAMKEGK